MKIQIKNLIDASLPEIGNRLNCPAAENTDYELEFPKTIGHGDLSTNLAFHLARLAKQSPLSVAEVIKASLEAKMDTHHEIKSMVQKIEVAKPGFVNFFLVRSAGNAVLSAIRKEGERFGSSRLGEGKKVLIEFVSANPTGPLTIAHGRQAVVGDALARLLRFTGHDVMCEYYLNDAGRQIRLLGASVLSRYAEATHRTFPFPEDGYQGEYIKVLAAEMLQTHGSAVPLNEEGAALASTFAVEKIMTSIRTDLSDLGVSFDSFFSEQSLYGKKLEESLEILSRKGYLYEKEGALWFRTSALGDEKDRVVRKSTGEFTYLAPDIVYHREKFMRGFNVLINLMGPDHHGYIPRLKAACQALGYDPNQLNVMLVQLVTLMRGGSPFRMSTRAGEFVTLRELMDEVGADATRVFFIQRRVDSHLDFDVELAKKRSDENPVYYLQYAHARLCSLLEFAGGRKVSEQADLSRLSESETVALVRLLTMFPERLADAGRCLEPFRVVAYLWELAQAFHKFYSCHRVVTEDAVLTEARLLLADAVRIVFRNGLSILGVTAPVKM